MTSKLGYIPRHIKSLANGINGTLTDEHIVYNSPVGFMTVTQVTDVTSLTARQVLGGLIVHTPTSSLSVDLPTAAEIVGALNGAGIGSSVRFTLRNAAAGAFNVTLDPNQTGVTLQANDLYGVSQNGTGEFMYVVTNDEPGDEAVTFYTIANNLVH